MLEMKLTMHGQVQGVGYRASIIRKIEINQVFVRGYIRNLPNGTVEILAQGDIEALKDLRRFANEGSDRSKVRECEEGLMEIPSYTYDDFSVHY